jgi:hypothetical protein
MQTQCNAQQHSADRSAVAILARQSELVSLARQAVGDANEAGLIVHRVMSRAFKDAESPDIAESLRRHLKSVLESRAA